MEVLNVSYSRVNLLQLYITIKLQQATKIYKVSVSIEYMATREVRIYDTTELRERAKVLDDSVLSAYDWSVNSKYNSEIARQTLSKFGSANGELIGSNIPLIHLQESGLLGNSRLVTRQNLEEALKYRLNLSGNYVHFGVALRGDNVSYAPNKTSAKNLVAQLKQRCIKLGRGVLIPLSALTQKEDSNSGYGLTLHLNDRASSEIIQNFEDFTWNWTTSEGIARAFLSRFGVWCSNFGDMTSSNDGGRVVVVYKEGASQNFLVELDKKEAEARKAYLNILGQKKRAIDLEIKRLNK